jgi:Zn-dependent M16 (insulinase) family peptidase
MHSAVNSCLLFFASCGLQEFHAKYYHPSNGRFWFYGDDDATKRLQILDGFLR